MNGHRGARLDVGDSGDCQRLAEGGDVALGIWVLVSLAGIGAGLLVAKYSQAWAADPFHPGAVVGSTFIVTSVALSFIALRRYLRHRAGHHPSPWLATLAGSLCTGLGWVALMIIAFVN